MYIYIYTIFTYFCLFSRYLCSDKPFCDQVETLEPLQPLELQTQFLPSIDKSPAAVDPGVVTGGRPRDPEAAGAGVP